MLRVQWISGITILLMISWASAAHAGHHQWIISEVFSNDDGTIQFVELLGTANGEGSVVNFTIDTSPAGTSGSIVTAASLAGPAIGAANLGQYYLVGTAGFAAAALAQSAPAPDATLPDNFLELAVDTVRYAGISGTDLSYTAGGLPTDGIDSLDTESPGGTVNTPQNASGATGSIDVSGAEPPGLPSVQRQGVIVLVGLVIFSATVLLRRRGSMHGAA